MFQICEADEAIRLAIRRSGKPHWGPRNSSRMRHVNKRPNVAACGRQRIRAMILVEGQEPQNQPTDGHFGVHYERSFYHPSKPTLITDAIMSSPSGEEDLELREALRVLQSGGFDASAPLFATGPTLMLVGRGSSNGMSKDCS